MSQEQSYELELGEETQKKLQDYAAQTGQSEEQVMEYIITEFLHLQLPGLEKQSAATGKPLQELLNQQFVKLLEMLRQRDLQQEK